MVKIWPFIGQQSEDFGHSENPIYGKYCGHSANNCNLNGHNIYPIVLRMAKIVNLSYKCTKNDQNLHFIVLRITKIFTRLYLNDQNIHPIVLRMTKIFTLLYSD